MEDWAHLKPLMQRERVATRHLPGTEYLGMYINGELIGVVGWMKIKNVTRYKTDYIHPNHRGNGYYKELFMARDALVNGTVSAFCTSMSLPVYLNNGFEKLRERDGITYVVRNGNV